MNWDLIYEPIITGLITGIFTIIAVKITIVNENMWKRKEEEKKELENKPRFKLRKTTFRNESEADMFILATKLETNVDENKIIRFKFDERLKEEHNMNFYDYIFENIGEGTVEEFWIVTNAKRDTSIMKYYDKDHYIKYPIPNYAVLYDERAIQKGEKLKIRIAYHKDLEFSNLFSATFSILYRDSNGNLWGQGFFERQNKLYEPRRIKAKEYLQMISIEDAMECFEKPWLW